jgi:hypothetical protein
MSNGRHAIKRTSEHLTISQCEVGKQYNVINGNWRFIVRKKTDKIVCIEHKFGRECVPINDTDLLIEPYN